eukprot:291826_1
MESTYECNIQSDKVDILIDTVQPNISKQNNELIINEVKENNEAYLNRTIPNALSTAKQNHIEEEEIKSFLEIAANIENSVESADAEDAKYQYTEMHHHEEEEHQTKHHATFYHELIYNRYVYKYRYKP